MKKSCGLDVHKDTIFCAIYNGKTYSEVKEFTTLTPDIYKLCEHLQVQSVHQVAMESTGIYWIPVWNILEAAGFECILVNPFLIKQMPGRKSDVKDAQWIASLLHKGLLRRSLVPNEQIRELRCYTRRYMKLQGQLTGVLTEMERHLECCSIRLSSFISTVNSQSLLKVIEAIVDGITDPETLATLVHGRIINSKGRATIRSALTGFITSQHRFLLSQCLDDYRLKTAQTKACIFEMEKLVEKHYDKQLALLQTVPGISKLSALIILAETGADMKVFESSSKFSGWTGLRPRNDESAGKYKSTAITKGNKYLRSILVQCAWAACRTKNSYFKDKFTRMAMRKSRKKALIAIARKLGVIIWSVLHYKQPYDPSRLPVYDPVKLKARENYLRKELEKITLLTNH